MDGLSGAATNEAPVRVPGAASSARSRVTRLGLAMVVLAPPALLWWNREHWPFFFALGLVANLALVYSAVRPNCRWFGPVVTQFRTDRKEVWLTIDDGPHPQDTPQVLDVLRKHRARATFFVVGQRVREHEAAARAIVREGHTLANHSRTHPALTFWCHAGARLAREIDEGAEIIRSVSGSLPRWFRPPVGMANPLAHLLLRDHGMRLIGWSARGLDGVTRDIDAALARILAAVRPGAIILLHEGRRDRRGRALSPILLDRLLWRLSAEGYAFVVPGEDRFL